MALFNNASPAHISLGAKDNSMLPIPYEAPNIGQHIPLIYMFARKGTTRKVFASSVESQNMYGAVSFNENSPYYTHTTEMAKAMAGAANSCVFKRLKPLDAGANASSLVYMDVLQHQIPNYVRDSLGNKVLDSVTGLFIVDVVTPTITGVEIKFINEQVATSVIGTTTPKSGTMTSGAVTSTMYPMLELNAAEHGDHYNNIGYTIESILSAAIDKKFLTTNKSLPYNLSLVERTTAGSTHSPLATLYGDPNMQMSLSNLAVDPVTSAKTDLKTVFESSWFNEVDQLLPIRYNDYMPVHVYQTNIDLVLNMIMTNEKLHITTTPTVWYDNIGATTTGWFDYTTADSLLLDSETYLINLFTGKSTTNVPYFTLVSGITPAVLGVGQTEVIMSKNTPVWLAGGSDGTMSLAVLDNLTTVEQAKYLDPNSEVIDDAINPESIIWDSGFSVNTKLDLMSLVALRSDTNVCVGTAVYSPGGVPVSVSQMKAIGVLLDSRALLLPESVYFGTPVCRVSIFGGDIKLRNTINNDYYPLTFDIAVKTAEMTGAGNRKWKSEMNFDHGHRAVVLHGSDYHPKFIPAGVKPLLANVGINWAQPKDINNYFLPMLQTAYPYDNSAMNSFLMALAIAFSNRVCSETHREFSGTSSMSDAVFVDQVTAFLINQLDGVFDSLVNVIPSVIITQNDWLRGYSWKVSIKLEGGVMKTVMVSETPVYRFPRVPL